jgi:hypothetical protein
MLLAISDPFHFLNFRELFRFIVSNSAFIFFQTFLVSMLQAGIVCKKMLLRALLPKITPNVSLFQFNQQACSNCYQHNTYTIFEQICLSLLEIVVCREDCIAGTRKPWSLLPKDGML